MRPLSSEGSDHAATRAHAMPRECSHVGRLLLRPMFAHADITISRVSLHLAAFPGVGVSAGF
jgi:hypothetical protein